jgi:D-alanyl-D-alanine carboxypeptidase (penicillin-binding protein 5/6)
VDKSDFSGITEEIVVFDKIMAPIVKGDELGAIIYKLNGQEIGKITLIAEDNVQEASYKDYLMKILSYF